MIRLVVFITILTLQVFAEDDWGDIEAIEVISSQPKQQSLSNYWDEHVYGSISGMSAFGQKP